MKKMLSLILTSAIASAGLSVGYAQEDYAKLIPEVKNRINIPEEYSEFEYNNSYTEGEKIRYSFSWVKETDGRKEYINAEVYSDGSVASYNKRHDSGQYDFLKVNLEDAQTVASEFIRRTNPDLKCELKFEPSKNNYGVQSFDIYAVFNGIEYYNPVGAISVTDELDVTRMNIDIPQFPENENATLISHSDGYNNYMDKIGVKTTYKTYADNKTKGIITFPAYSLDCSKAIDAITGEVVEINSYRFETANTALKTEMAADAAGGYSGLTESEIKKITEIEKLITTADALENVKDRLEFAPSSDKVYFNADSYGDYTYNFYEDDYFVSVNAQNGDITSFSNYSEDKKVVFDIKSESDAWDWFNKLAPEESKKYKIDQERLRLEEKNPVVGFLYEHDGIRVEGAGANIGQSHFSMTSLMPYEKAEYISKSSFKPIDEIFGDINTVRLRYVDTDDGVVAAYMTEAVTVNAQTGKKVNHRNEEIKEKNYAYSDLDGHWVKEAAQKLALAGVGFDDELFRPDREVTEKEAVSLLNDFYYKYDEDEKEDTENSITRTKFAYMLAERMGYEKVISFDIFVAPYDDVDENCGAIAILKALGVIDSDSESFRPDDKLTRAEAVVMIYRALMTQ